jgi:1-acyl-sn-glycerol-3-phosphate acyltransferase
MVAFRSFLFNVVALILHLFLLLGMLVLLPLPRRWMQVTVAAWTWTMKIGLRYIVGLELEARGLANRPKGAAVYASKHQSAWDTFVFYLLLDDPNYIMKTELRRIPFWGWYADKCGAIFIDRAGGAGALKRLVRDVRDRLAKGRQVIIFPEGTRTAPGARRPYLPGVAAIYAMTAAPVVPVAVNSGLFWGRHSFLKEPGVVTLEFLPAMPKGLKREAFMAELAKRIETATDALVAEARARSPRLKAEDAKAP